MALERIRPLTRENVKDHHVPWRGEDAWTAPIKTYRRQEGDFYVEYHNINPIEYPRGLWHIDLNDPNVVITWTRNRP